jgi:hypothetical protein
LWRIGRDVEIVILFELVYVCEAVLGIGWVCFNLGLDGRVSHDGSDATLSWVVVCGYVLNVVS